MEMHKIIEEIEASHLDLFNWLDQQDINSWTMGPEGKWTTGQHIVHLIQSSAALVKGLKVPKFILAYKFGKSNRPSRDYDTIKNNYESKLKANAKVVSPYSRKLNIPTVEEKQKTVKQLKDLKDKLVTQCKKWKLDKSVTYLLPHPLLGRMTINEILFWTAIHTRHHLNTLKEKY